MHAEQGAVSPLAVGVGGLVGGAIIGAGLMAAKKVGAVPVDPPAGSDREARP